MGKGLHTRPGDYELAFRYFESFSPMPGEPCREAWESLPEREKVGWYRRARAAQTRGNAGDEQIRRG